MPGKRYFICAGVSQYKYKETLLDLPGVVSETRTMTDLMVGTLGYEHALDHLTLDWKPRAGALAKAEFEFDIESWFSSHATRSEECKNDAVVLYLSGHGVFDLSSRNTFLMLSDSDPALLGSTAVEIGSFVQTVLRHANNGACAQILIVLDTCFAGDAVAKLAKEASELVQFRPELPARLAMLATTGVAEKAGQRVFASALDHVLRHRRSTLRDSRSPWLGLDPITTAVQGVLDTVSRNAVPQKLQTHLLGHNWKFFPDVDRQARPSEAPRHWVGRTCSSSALEQWLADPSQGKLLVVSGKAGRGKSALLAHFWSRPEKTEQPLHWISARYKDTTEFAADLASAFCLQPPDQPDRLPDEVAEHRTGRSFVLIVDALDEAANVGWAVGTLFKLVRLKTVTVRVILGTRPRPELKAELHRLDPGNWRSVDLDEPVVGDLTADHVAEYVRKSLNAPHAAAGLESDIEDAVTEVVRVEPATATSAASRSDIEDAVTEVVRRWGDVFLMVKLLCRFLDIGDQWKSDGAYTLADRIGALRKASPSQVKEAFDLASRAR